MNVKFFQYACLVVGSFACGVAVAAPSSGMFATGANTTSGDSSSSRGGNDTASARSAPDAAPSHGSSRLPVPGPSASSDDDATPASQHTKPADLGWPSLLPGSFQ